MEEEQQEEVVDLDAPEGEPEGVEEAAPEPPKPEKSEETVPLAALLEVRDESRALKAEIEQMRQSQQPREPERKPDIFEDPEGYDAYRDRREQQLAQNLRLEMINTNLNNSERLARQQHGDEAVQKALEWTGTLNPQQREELLFSPDPYGTAIERMGREARLSELGDSDFEEFQKWKAAQQRPDRQPPADPPATVQGMKAGHVKDPTKMSMGEYVAWRSAQT